jgi:hypothetical protein
MPWSTPLAYLIVRSFRSGIQLTPFATTLTTPAPGYLSRLKNRALSRAGGCLRMSTEEETWLEDYAGSTHGDVVYLTSEDL